MLRENKQVVYGILTDYGYNLIKLNLITVMTGIQKQIFFNNKVHFKHL